MQKSRERKSRVKRKRLYIHLKMLFGIKKWIQMTFRLIFDFSMFDVTFSPSFRSRITTCKWQEIKITDHEHLKGSNSWFVWWMEGTVNAPRRNNINTKIIRWKWIFESRRGRKWDYLTRSWNRSLRWDGRDHDEREWIASKRGWNR